MGLGLVAEAISSEQCAGFSGWIWGWLRRPLGGPAGWKPPGGGWKITDSNLQPTEVGFVCVDAVSTAGFYE